MVIMLLDFLNVCECAHVQMCMWPADEKQTSIPSPWAPLQHNPWAFVLISSPVILLSHLLSPVHTALYVCARGYRDPCTVHVHCLALIPTANFSPARSSMYAAQGL